MRRFPSTLFTLAVAISAVCACDKTVEPEGRRISAASLGLSPRVVEEEFYTIDKKLSVTFQDVHVFDRDRVSVNTGEQYNSNLIDLHIEVLPLYIFEGSQLSGDYYGVRGYVVAHNGESFYEKKLPTHSMDDDYVSMYGWYMGKLNLSFQLLSPYDEDLNQDQVRFFATPEPSTTIGATTYKKGFSFRLGVTPINIGGARIEMPGKEPSWKTIAMGLVSLGFNWEDSSTQILPDQGVEMDTDPWTRKVSYSFISNNIGAGFGPDAIPSRFRTDQRVDFSFVWHVPEGNFCARDRDFGSIKLKVTMKPEYRADISGNIRFTTEEVGLVEIKGVKAKCNSMEFVTDLPAMNRIPTGNINFKNTTRSYATDIQIWREGEYGTSAEPYLRIDSDLDTNDEVSCMVREGIYDYVYELKNGDTGDSKGIFAVKSITLEAGAEIDISTLNGKRLE